MRVGWDANGVVPPPCRRVGRFAYPLQSMSFLITLFFRNFAGLPPTTVHGATSWVTSDSAPITAPFPIVMPFEIVLRVATQTLFPMVIGAVIISKYGEFMLWDAVSMYTSLPIQHCSPIVTFARQRMQQYSPRLDSRPILRFHGSIIVAVESNEHDQSISAPNIRVNATLYFLIKNGVHLNIPKVLAVF